MKRSCYNILIDFLQGSSWALVIIVSALLFIKMYPYGLFLAVFSSFFGACLGLFFVIFFEIAKLQMKKITLLEEQIKLLKEIKEKL